MSRAVVVGDRPLVLGFKGVGFEVIHAGDGEQLNRELTALARSGDVSIVLVTEEVAAEAPEALRQFRTMSKAILTTIPTHKGSRHIGFNEIRKVVEYSIGVDMLGKE